MSLSVVDNDRSETELFRHVKKSTPPLPYLAHDDECVIWDAKSTLDEKDFSPTCMTTMTITEVVDLPPGEYPLRTRTLANTHIDNLEKEVNATLDLYNREATTPFDSALTLE